MGGLRLEIACDGQTSLVTVAVAVAVEVEVDGNGDGGQVPLIAIRMIAIHGFVIRFQTMEEVNVIVGKSSVCWSDDTMEESVYL